MELIHAFRFYKDNYDLIQKLNHKRYVVVEYIILIFLRLVTWTYINRLFKLFLNRLLKSKKFSESQVVVFIFGQNHANVYRELENNGFDFCIYNILSSSAVDNLKGETISINRLLLLISIMANSSRFLNSWKNGKDLYYIKHNFFRMLKLSGLELIFEHLLKDQRTILKFNDHNPYSFLLFDLAKKLNVKTVYIQHSPVSERFPELHHDLNVLFSEDSVEKYKNENNKRIIKLFDFRFLSGLKYRKYKTRNRKILIAFNQLDDLDQVLKIVNNLNADFELILRPHPADKRDIKSIELIDNVKRSRNKSIFDDLKEVTYVICNETAVPLESIFLDKLTFKAAFLSESFDNYGFIRQGLIKEEFTELQDLVNSIKQNKNFSNKDKLTFFLGDLTNHKDKIRKLYHEILSV
ncbi:hypothetical protein [Nonlabens tegetincola]|uniref:hypothetical protein n=1 Tax=Nonlabens tegetincola TaxID=323273 RepID=UPI000CF3C45E|nr:hypothetical protein [Nonlabens tegetincola]PQJ18521.1 hypothetical protein BST93_08530 [Nonlabens tegetincola]